MSEIIEKRHAQRVHIACELRYRATGSEQFHEACCIDLSCSGIAFCSDHEFQIGEEIEVQLIPDPPIRYITTLIVKIVRNEPQDNGSFKIGAAIDYGDTQRIIHHSK
jgi:hypothetical protein